MTERSRPAPSHPIDIRSRPGDTPETSDPHSTRGGPGQPPTASDFPFLSPPDRPEDLGRLGGFRVRHLLGAGGMGFVFRAEDDALRRPVALKVMRPEVAARPAARERFLREGRSAAAVKSDHVVTIYQVGEDNGVPFLAMECLDGESLADWLREHPGPAPAPFIARVARDVLAGLAAAHARGLVHRDIKPANLWVEAPTGRIKVLDFGLTRPGADPARLTEPGAVVGTPAYMAPEQARGDPVDSRTDLWSLGVVLYRMASGTNPFQRDSVYATLQALSTVTPPTARAIGGLPTDLAGLIDRLLTRDPAGRPADAGAARAGWASREEPAVGHRRRPHPGWLAGAAMVAAAVVAVAVGNPFRGRGTAPAVAPSPPAEAAVEVERFDVTVHELVGPDTYRPRGVLGTEGGPFTARTTDAITVEARLSRPAHCYLLAFQADGAVTGLYPQDEGDAPDPTDRPAYPSKRRASKFGLEDGDGLWVVALVASLDRLPGLATWRAGRPPVPWQRYPKPLEQVVLSDDGRRLEALTPGQPPAAGVRAEKADRGAAPVVRVVDWLRRETGGRVAAVAFPVVMP